MMLLDPNGDNIRLGLFLGFGSAILKGRHFEWPPFRRADNLVLTLTLTLV